jgi:hypothetical protein
VCRMCDSTRLLSSRDAADLESEVPVTLSRVTKRKRSSLYTAQEGARCALATVDTISLAHQPMRDGKIPVKAIVFSSFWQHLKLVEQNLRLANANMEVRFHFLASN